MSALNQFKLGTQLYIYKVKQFIRKMHDSYTYIQIKKQVFLLKMLVHV